MEIEIRIGRTLIRMVLRVCRTSAARVKGEHDRRNKVRKGKWGLIKVRVHDDRTNRVDGLWMGSVILPANSMLFSKT